ncbi:sulfatase [Pseudoclavibacter sp. RFBB5]|uniref:sulfatase n=1 Tax=Pseudoclavibacter sp. RFBB5 TaxID=2080574 RepID=UPI000CE72FB6|nr:sulfatase [Pseudoclavibacter sp. RFBB5]PPG33503.1 sulfatase [Pseudoclavibacter sp. RFBB5]
MRAIVMMFDSLNRNMLPPYGGEMVKAPNFERLAARSVTFDNFYAGSLPCIPARRELHTGRYNFLHRSWGPLEPFDDSTPELLGRAGVHTHLATDHFHYVEDGGATYHPRFTTWELFRGQDGDPWKGVVDAGVATAGFRAKSHLQDAVNRDHMPSVSEHSQTLTVDAGLDFISRNADADRWMLQLELFDPHEPFFTHEQYKQRYPHDYDGPEFDWPPYAKVTEPESQIEHARMEYAALVSMCDDSLGRVLDAMDEHDLWDDTLLIVNTDHGLLLGEHGWWGKNFQPWYNELVQLPMFMWDPRQGSHGTRREELAQTIDIAPTLLGFFGVDVPMDMQGVDLGQELGEGPHREGGLFGIHGGHVNVTDGRYVYMRASLNRENAPLEEYTLMPTHMRSRFKRSDLVDWEPAAPRTFTKGVRTMCMQTRSLLINSWTYGTLLFDLQEDPDQLAPIVDDDVELRMLNLLADLMRENDAPESQFERLGMPATGRVTPEHLLVRAQRDRAESLAESMPDLSDLPETAVRGPQVKDLLRDPVAKTILDRHAPELSKTELLALPTPFDLYQLTRMGAMPSSVLRSIAEDFAALEANRE